MHLPQKLVLAAARLEGDHPAAWGDFVSGLQEQIDKAATALLYAPPDQILAAQGRCHSLTVLMDGLKTARVDAAKIHQQSAPAKR